MAEENIVSENVLKKVSEEIVKDTEASTTNVANSVIFTALFKKAEQTRIINRILDYLFKLEDNNLSRSDKDAIFYMLAGNNESLGLFLNKQFVSSYVIFLYQASKEDSFIKNLKVSQCNHLVYMLKKKSIEASVNCILRTVATCMVKEVGVPESAVQISKAIESLNKFDFRKQNLKAVRKELQEINYKQVYEDRRTQEEKDADLERNKRLMEEFKEQVKSLGGIEQYSKFLREEAKKSQPIKVITIQDADIDEVVDCRKEEDYFEIRNEIKTVLEDIMNIYRAAFDISIIMQKFSGTYVFSDFQVTNEESKSYGVMQVVETGKDGAVKLVTKAHKSSALLKWLQYDYEYPIKENMRVARHNEVPSLENIIVKGYNYYPTFITRYALGFVKKEKYKNFDKFMAAVRNDVEDRLYAIYKSECSVKDKVFYGADLFDASNRDRLKLIGAFTNAVIFLTGSGADNFDNSQLRCISAYTHQKEATYYTKFDTFADGQTKGLSDAAQVKYIIASKAFKQNILDITHIKDRESFYKTVSWAYRELGQVYGSGEIPDIKNREPVVIGKTLSGELVKFDLGENSSFVTSIYAGSRSGKGVTTLSILAAIMAGGIGICYLDCKPDMVNCFWDMENRAIRAGKQGHVYAYDTHASQNRLGYTAMNSLTTQCSSLINSNIASALFILKNLQLITLTGQYKQRKEDSSYHVWIIDEVNNMLNILEAGYGELEKRAPKSNAKELTDEQKYIKAIMNFWQNLQVSVASGVNDTYGQCGYRFIVIGQNPGAMFKSSKPTGKLTSGGDILRVIGNAPVNKYILGRGVNISGGFGSKAFHNDETRSAEEKNALENYKYFIMRNEGQVNSGAKDESVLFQPFLTLNFDDVLASCWTGGLGKSYNYDSSIKQTDAAYPEMIKNYKRCINATLGLNTELTTDVLNATEEGHGVIDEGTGFYGLVKMYYSKYGKEADNKVLDVALRPYREIEQMLTEMKLLGEGSLFGYNSVEDFLYDFSIESMSITNYDELLQKIENNSGEDTVYNSEDMDNIDIQENVVYTQQAAPSETVISSDEDLSLSDSSTLNAPSDSSYSDTNEVKSESLGIDDYTDEELDNMIINLEDNTVELQSNDDRSSLPDNKDVIAATNTAEEIIQKNSVNSFSNTVSRLANQRQLVDASVRMQVGTEAGAVRIDSSGRAVVKSFNYVESVLNRRLINLEEEYREYSDFKFIDDALIKRNIKKRYKTFIKSIQETIGWINVDRLELEAERLIFNNKYTIHAYSLGELSYNLYDTMDFADLLFNRLKRIRYLVLDEDISERVIAECGGGVYELLFNSLLTLQVLQIGNIKMNRHSRQYSKELALKAEVEKAEKLNSAKDAMAEELFASGSLKKTPNNLAIAEKILMKAKKTERIHNSKGLLQARKILSMTPMQAITGLVAGVFLGLGGLIKKAQSI